MVRSAHVPKTYQNTVKVSGLPENIKRVMISNYGDPYALEQYLEKLPYLTQPMRLKILKLLVEGSGGILVDE